MARDGNALEALRADLVARLPIDADRVLLTGMSPPGRPKGEYTAVRSTEVA